MSIPNVEKLFQYLQCFSKHPIEYNETKIGDQITQIKLNSTLFYSDNCLNCGGCDPAESNIYTISEYTNIMNCKDDEFVKADLDPTYLHKLQNGLRSKKLNINHQDVTVWEYKQESNELYLPSREKILARCTWCFKDLDNKFKCRIHPVESITCIMPHLKVFHVKGSCRSSIGLHQFGRNWALKCPVSLTEPQTVEEFEYNKYHVIDKLKRLNQCSLDLNIDSYIPEVISNIEKQEFGKFNEMIIDLNQVKQRKLF